MRTGLIQVKECLELEVIVKLTGKFLDKVFVVVDWMWIGTHGRTAAGTGFEIVTNLAAIVASVFFGEKFANVFTGRREIIR